MLDTQVALDGSARREGPSAVLHFASHCDTSGESDAHEIRLGTRAERILLGELKTTAGEPESWLAARPRPLVFVNACGSAPAPVLASRTSFPLFFLDRESVGVVGTLCDISDDVAAHFAAVFYELLLRGATVGEAVHGARWHLVEWHGNPLGLLYVYYGDPDVKVVSPHGDRVIPACALLKPSA